LDVAFFQKYFSFHALAYVDTFIDDIKGRWRGTEKEFREFVEICNNNEIRIKVTVEIYKEEAIFLDTKVIKEEEGKVRKDLYVKPRGTCTWTRTTQGI
jgi:hypothetical protein